MGQSEVGVKSRKAGTPFRSIGLTQLASPRWLGAKLNVFPWEQVPEALTEFHTSGKVVR